MRCILSDEADVAAMTMVLEESYSQQVAVVTTAQEHERFWLMMLVMLVYHHHPAFDKQETLLSRTSPDTDKSGLEGQ